MKLIMVNMEVLIQKLEQALSYNEKSKQILFPIVSDLKVSLSS